VAMKDTNNSISLPPAGSNGSVAADARKAVIDAMEDARYEWRTLDGLAEQTKLPIEEIRQLIDYLQDEIIRSSVPDERGRDLYTTRKHYRQTHGLGTRLLTALSDKVA